MALLCEPSVLIKRLHSNIERHDKTKYTDRVKEVYSIFNNLNKLKWRYNSDLYPCSDECLPIVCGKKIMKKFNSRLVCDQPRSQALSPLPPFVVGRKTLVAAGHVINQNLGGKKICWMGGVAEYFDCCCGKLCGFQNLEQSLKKLPALSGFEVGFCR